MKRVPAAVLLGAVALAGCANSGRKPHASTRAGAVPAPVAEVRAEVSAARASNAELFAIFPRLPGEKPCTIPVSEGLRESKVVGRCRTRVWYPNTHGHGEARVAFRESWGNGRFSSWTMWEELPARKVLVTKLHGDQPPQLRYAATDGVAADIELTRGVPCPTGRRPPVGPVAVRRFHAVAAISCVDQFRTYPGQGQWEVQVRRVAVGSISALQGYFEQPSTDPSPPKGEGCAAVLIVTLVPVFVDAQGRWLLPVTPRGTCGEPREGGPPNVRWHVVSVRRIRQQISAPALAAHCPMRVGNTAAFAGPREATHGGPLFDRAPWKARICIYRAPPNHIAVGHFVRGFRLDAAETRRLLAALTGPGPRRGCPKQRTFAAVAAPHGSGASVELGGCYRVERPDRTSGTANSAVVRAILEAR